MSTQAKKSPRQISATGKKAWNIYCTEEELKAARAHVETLRKPALLGVPAVSLDDLKNLRPGDTIYPAPSAWVRESDRLPDPGTLVICACTGLHRRYQFGHIVDGQWNLLCNIEQEYAGGEVAVVWWMDFPDAPKEETAETFAPIAVTEELADALAASGECYSAASADLSELSGVPA